MFNKYFLSLLALYSLHVLCLSHLHEDDEIRCGHDLEGGNEMAKQNQVNDLEYDSDNENVDGLSLQSDLTSSWQNIRIALNYSYLEANTILTASEKQVVKNAMTGSVNFLQRLLRLDRISNGINVTCNGVKLKCNDCDLILRVQASDCSYKASASACVSDGSTGRNIAGSITWCYNAIRSSIWNRDVEIAIHEIIHVLGFSSSNFDDWLDAPYGKRRGTNATKYVNFYTGSKYSLKTSQVLNTMRDHFDCNTIEGAPLEENGGAGSASSHWDYRMFLGDLMTAKSNDAVDLFGKMTAAALEDTNWYRVNWDYVNDWRFGKNEGCSFLTGSCIDSNGETPYPEYFCDVENSNGCWWDRTVAHAPCVLTKSTTCPYAYANDICGYEWSDYCPIYRIADTVQTSADTCQDGFNIVDQTVSGSAYGINSRCVSSTLNNQGSNGGLTTEKGRCYKMQCLNYDSTNGYYNDIMIFVGTNNSSSNINITCSREESNNQTRKFINTNYYYGDIQCPPIDIICGSSSKSFQCLYGSYNDNLAKCVCNPGYTGTICDSYDNSTASSLSLAPTSLPTPLPTISSPTSKPTSRPTSNPTFKPTSKPTPKPTPAPTKPICCLTYGNGRCGTTLDKTQCQNSRYNRKQCYWDTNNPLCE